MSSLNRVSSSMVTDGLALLCRVSDFSFSNITANSFTPAGNVCFGEWVEYAIIFPSFLVSQSFYSISLDSQFFFVLYLLNRSTICQCMCQLSMQEFLVRSECLRNESQQIYVLLVHICLLCSNLHCPYQDGIMFHYMLKVLYISREVCRNGVQVSCHPGGLIHRGRYLIATGT